MTPASQSAVLADVLQSLRANPVLASVSEEAMGKIAELVVQETQAQVGSALRGIDLFAGLSDQDYERLRDIAEPVVAEADTVLFREGDAGDRLYVVVRGAVELSERGEGPGPGERSVSQAGEAFGELALLNDAARPATARVTEPSYLIAISRDAFLEAMGADSLASRLWRNLSRALPNGPARPSSKEMRRDSPREALAEYNRMVRGRFLPRGVPSFPGYDLTGTTVVHEHGEGSAAWDWFFLSDGRLALAVLKADQASLSSAHRLLVARGLLRDFGQDPIPGLGALLTRANRGLRAGWVDGISGSVSCGVMAVSEDGVEWATAGGVGGTLVRADGSYQDLVPEAPALGSDDDLEYRSVRLRLGTGDHVLAFSDGPSDSVIVGRRFLAARGKYRSEKERLDALVARIREADDGLDWIFDVTAVLVGRTVAVGVEGVPSGSDAIARAAAVFDRSLGAEEGA